MLRRLSLSRRKAGIFAMLAVAVSIPVVTARASEPLDCKAVHDGGLRWQWMALPDGVNNPTGFAVDYLSPNRLLVSNSSQIFISDNHGCSWTNAVTLGPLAQEAGYSSAISRIVDVGFSLKGAAIATISEGVGSEARPHVIQSATGARGTWNPADTGLPAVGEPRTMGVGVFGFVIGLAQFGSDVGGGLPGGITDPSGQLPAMVYTSPDGEKWTPRAGTEAFGGRNVITQITADLLNPNRIYAVVGGRLYYSHDNGATFHAANLPGTPTAIATATTGELGVFGNDFARRSFNGGLSFLRMPTVTGARSTAWRTDGSYLVATNSKIYRVLNGKATNVTPRVRVYDDDHHLLFKDDYPGGTPSMRSTFAGEATWYVTAGHRLYRWFDDYKPAKQPPGVPNERVSYPPPPGRITPTHPIINLPLNGTRVQRYRLELPKSPTPIDVYYLLDVSTSMINVIDDLRGNAKQIGVDLAKQGINVNEGVGAIGTAPNLKAGTPPDPPTNPTPQCQRTQPTKYPPGCEDRGPYHQPVLYKRWAPIGAVNQKFFDALKKILPEYYIASGICPQPPPPDWNGCEAHMEGALVSLMQSVTGSGVSSPDLPVPVAPGQAAGFRANEDVRRVIILATDERFWAPPGTPMTSDGKPDLAKVAKLLRDHDIHVVGLSNDSGPSDSRPYLRTMARLTNTVAPKGGLPCRYGDEGKFIPAGQPVVCEDSVGVSKVVVRLLNALPDFQNVSLSVARKSPVLRGISDTLYPKVNVKSPFTTQFTATYSCVGLAPGSYPVAITANLRGYNVASTVATVNCGAPLIPPTNPKLEPAVPVTQNPPPQPPPPPPAPAPAQPVTQAQTQPQAQVNPQIGSAAQEQEQLQLALAQAGIYLADDDDEKVTQEAMSTRRNEERVAVALLAAAMASSSIVGLAMMRRHRAQAAAGLAPAWIRRSSSR